MKSSLVLALIGCTNAIQISGVDKGKMHGINADNG